MSWTLEDPTEWTSSIVLKGDVIEQATRLKQTVDGDILVYGSGPLYEDAHDRVHRADYEPTDLATPGAEVETRKLRGVLVNRSYQEAHDRAHA